MPAFDVIGAERETGREVRRTVEAESAEAVARIVGRSMLVERIVPVAPAPAAAAHLPPPAVAYATPVPPTVAPREYKAIRSGAAALSVAGSLLIVGGVIAAAVGVLAVVGGSGAGLSLVVSGAASVVAGLLVGFIAAVGLAVRDIARGGR